MTWQKFILPSILLVCLISISVSCKKSDDEPVTSKRSITISGSASGYPLLQRIAAAYEKKNPLDRVLFYSPVHSDGGVAGPAEGTCDLGLVSRELTPAERKIPLLHFPVAKDVLAFAVHKDVGVAELTTEDIKAIFAGLITNWRDLQGQDQEIVVLDRPDHTSAKKVFFDCIGNPDFAVTDKALILERPDQMNESLEIIPGSIGYTSFSELHFKKMKARLVLLDGVHPTSPIQQKSYPYKSRRYVLLSNNRPKGLVKSFLDFIISEEGREIIQDAGMLPEERKIVIGLLPEFKITKQETRYGLLAEYLAKNIGVTVEINHSPGYRNFLQDFETRVYDASFMGSFAFVWLDSKLPMEVLARPQIGGKNKYRGLIFARRDAEIKESGDMEGKSICLVEATTAGYLFPQVYFKEQGISYPEYFGNIIFSSSHEEAIYSVLHGRCQIGAAKDLVLQRLSQKKSSLVEELVVIETSSEMPTNGFAVREDFDWDLKEDLKRVLLNMHEDPEAQKILAKLGAEYFLPIEEGEYRNVNSMLDTLGLDSVSLLENMPKGLSVSSESREEF